MTDFNSAQYKRVIAACKERSEIPTMDWIPDKEECVHTQLHEADQHRLILNQIDLTKDSEYVRLYGQQAELIEQWVKEEEQRPPPMPPMSPFKK
jgi:hypothetical protein